MCYYLIGQKAVGDGHGLDFAPLIGAQACPNFLGLFFSSILGAASPRDGNLPSPIAAWLSPLTHKHTHTGVGEFSLFSAVMSNQLMIIN